MIARIFIFYLRFDHGLRLEIIWVASQLFGGGQRQVLAVGVSSVADATSSRREQALDHDTAL